VHDAARPLAGALLFRSVITTAARVGGAVPGLPAAGLVPVGDDGPAAAPSLAARCLTAVQTPQAFRAAELLAAYSRAGDAGYQGTDTSSSIEAFADLTVRVVAGSRHNIKITYPRDVRVAERLLAARGRTPAEP
jgi:2-C-methyl-D-erythritol 4-phosphate cytidylyltransferase